MRLASLPVSILLLAVSLAAGCQSSASTEAVFADGAQLEVLADGMGFVEGPVWLESEQRLVFSDIPERKLRSWSRQDGLSLYRESPHPNGNMLDEEGRLLTCRHGERDLVRTEADGSLTVLATGWNGRRFSSPNDLSVRADGTIWFTDPPWGLPRQREGRELDWNGVYRLDPSTGEVVLLSKEHTMPNGIGLSPDGQTLYLADTGGHPSHPDPARHELPALFVYTLCMVGTFAMAEWLTAHHLRRSPAQRLSATLKWVLSAPAFCLLFLIPSLDAHATLTMRTLRKKTLTYSSTPRQTPAVTPKTSHNELDQLVFCGRCERGEISLDFLSA